MGEANFALSGYLFRASASLTAPFGMSHARLIFNMPSIRFSLQSLCTRLADIPQSSAASCAVTYSNISVLLKLYCIYHSRLNELYQFIKHEFYLPTRKATEPYSAANLLCVNYFFLNNLPRTSPYVIKALCPF